VQLYRYSVSQSSEFLLPQPFVLLLNECSLLLLRYGLSPETFGYTLVNHHVPRYVVP